MKVERCISGIVRRPSGEKTRSLYLSFNFGTKTKVIAGELELGKGEKKQLGKWDMTEQMVDLQALQMKNASAYIAM